MVVNREFPKDLVDFGDVNAAMKAGIDEKQYYNDLLAVRNGAAATFRDLYPEATAEEVEAAIQKHLTPKPVSGVRRFVVDAWVRRGYHTLTKVVPVALLAALGAGAIEMRAYSAEQSLQREESRVETLVETLHGKIRTESSKNTEILRQPVQTQLPTTEQNLVISYLRSSTAGFSQAKEMIGPYVREGRAGDLVTRANFASVERELIPIDNLVTRAMADQARALVVHQEQTDLGKAKDGLTQMHSTLVAGSTPVAMQRKAQEIYARGEAGLASRNVNRAQGALAALTAVRDELNEYQTVSRAAENTISSVQALSCSASQLTEFTALQTRYRLALQSANVPQMASLHADMKSLGEVLATKYEMRAVGGIEIFQNRNPSMTNYYIRVQAEENGNVIRLAWQDADMPTPKPIKTPQWGEEVPQHVYEFLGGNGIPRNNNIIGEKQRCEVQPSYNWEIRTGTRGAYVMNRSLSRITPHNPDGNLDAGSEAGRRNWRSGRDTR